MIILPPTAKNDDFLDWVIQGGPPAAKNHDFSDWVIQGGPAAARKS